MYAIVFCLNYQLYLRKKKSNIYIEKIINKINNLKIMVIKNIIWDLKTKGRRGWS